MKENKKFKEQTEGAKKEVQTEEEGVQLTDEELSQVNAGGEPGTLGTTGAGVEFKPVQ